MDRYSFEVNSGAHSAYLALGKDGNVVGAQNEGACYFDLTCGTPVDRLYTYFGEDRVDSRDWSRDYVQWFINSKPFREAFLTRDAEEGFKSGFEINTDIDLRYAFGCMMMLRSPFEALYPNSWGEYVKMGFSKPEAHALSINFVVGGNGFLAKNAQTNHLVLQKGYSYKHYRGKRVQDFDGPTFKDGKFLGGISCWWGTPGYHQGLEPNKIPSIQTVKIGKGTFNKSDLFGVKANKKNLDVILKWIKEKR